MGCCDSENKSSQRVQENGNRVQQRYNPNSKMHNVDLNLYDVIRSVCKIEADGHIASGFFIKLKDIKFFMTNEHVIPEKIIRAKENIFIHYDCEKKSILINLNTSQRYIQDFKYMNIDITIVEILPNDNIDDDLFLYPEICNVNNLINKEIYIVQYPFGGDMCYSEGEIINIDTNRYELTYNSSTEIGSSGSPVCLKNSSKVIGIHKEGNENVLIFENYGSLIYPIIDEINYFRKNNPMNNPLNLQNRLVFNKRPIYNDNNVQNSFFHTGINFNRNNGYNNYKNNKLNQILIVDNNKTYNRSKKRRIIPPFTFKMGNLGAQNNSFDSSTSSSNTSGFNDSIFH